MLQKKTAVATNEVVTITSQWAGLCFCSGVCKLYRPPALTFELSLDEKQKIILLWPYVNSAFHSVGHKYRFVCTILFSLCFSVLTQVMCGLLESTLAVATVCD